VLAAIERILNAEAEASGAPKKPKITPLDRYPLVKHDPEAAKRVGDAFRQYFPADRVQATQPTTASEDFGSFGAEWGAPSVFWFVGGTDPSVYAKAQKKGNKRNTDNTECLKRIHSDLAGRTQLLVDEIAPSYFPDRPRTIVPLAISLAVITQSARRVFWRRISAEIRTRWPLLAARLRLLSALRQ
jgi:hypothetical protein